MPKGVFLDSETQTFSECVVSGGDHAEQIRSLLKAQWFQLLQRSVPGPIELDKNGDLRLAEIINISYMFVIYVSEQSLIIDAGQKKGFYCPYGWKIYGNGLILGIHDNFGQDTDIWLSTRFLKTKLGFWSQN